MGKSSLVARMLAAVRSRQYTVVDFDFQGFDEQSLGSLETLLRSLAEAIHERLQLATNPDALWQGRLGVKDKLSSYLREYVLRESTVPVVMVMDEVDRVFGRGYENDFFGLLRFWHNERARDPLWRKLHLVLAWSTDPRQMLKDPGQSPFNVGTKIQLIDFSFAEVQELNALYGRPLKRKEQLQRLFAIIGGHPYLTQRALYALATRTHTLSSIVNMETAQSGLFADHLEHHRAQLVLAPELHHAMQQVIRNDTCPTHDVFVRLRALGLVTGRTHQAVSPRCTLYTVYFRGVLS